MDKQVVAVVVEGDGVAVDAPFYDAEVVVIVAPLTKPFAVLSNR